MHEHDEMSEPSTPNAMEPIVEAILQGRKLEAIKLVRDQANMGLAEAKELVEHMEKELLTGGPEALDAILWLGELKPDEGLQGAIDMHEDVLALVRAGRKLEAIQRCRELTGLGLAEAKFAVDSLEEAARETSGARLVETEGKRGCMGVIAVALLGSFLLAGLARAAAGMAW